MNRLGVIRRSAKQLVFCTSKLSDIDILHRNTSHGQECFGTMQEWHKANVLETKPVYFNPCMLL
jgi:hypothetical protein